MWTWNLSAGSTILGLATTLFMGVQMLMPLEARPGLAELRGTIDPFGQAQLRSITELQADSRGHFVTEAEIDNTAIRVLVDTGASAVALSYEDADHAGLRPRSLNYDIPVATANGVTKAARVMLRRVEVGGVVVRDVEGLVLPEGVMSGTLLGMSFLSRLRSFKIEDGVLQLRD